MARLLVSVRDLAEAQLAVECGVDLVDLKEPAAGALGAVDSAILNEVLAMFGEHVPISAALGELLDFKKPVLPSGLDFAKVGLAGCATIANWPRLWHQFADQLPEGTQAVAVAYADAERAVAPTPLQVIRVTAPLGARALLIDTWCKAHGGLVDLLRYGELGEIIQTARAAGLLVVLGGSLTLETIPDVLRYEPDVIAVRGAACAQTRVGALDRAKVCGLVKMIRRQIFLDNHSPHGSREKAIRELFKSG